MGTVYLCFSFCYARSQFRSFTNWNSISEFQMSAHTKHTNTTTLTAHDKYLFTPFFFPSFFLYVSFTFYFTFARFLFVKRFYVRLFADFNLFMCILLKKKSVKNCRKKFQIVLNSDCDVATFLLHILSSTFCA